MRKLNLYLILLWLFTLTVLLVYDFFSTFSDIVNIPKFLLIVLLLVIVIVSIFTSNKNKEDDKVTLYYQTFLLIYLFGLIILFTILGGTSQIGLNLNNPILWILIAISIFEIFQQKKKVKGNG
ncbi:hypothetical protein [Bacillus sp. Cr_A10]|uniref:hypothetical protein n=1 Tax=Bacillus sp. Cr_A10 TaxID=3033993 RepID=UPI0023DAE9B5|nr:hypothetical protein [Bacillus sp. Cr_A10]MDF2067468.1 hypothetical protein [Bacillus sp. Cr_A10]